MKKTIIYILTFLNIGCSNNGTKITGKYQGYFYETLHKMTLNPNMTFEYITEGHLGGDPAKGSYTIKNDTIVLNSVKRVPFGKYYLKSQDGCIINLEMHRDLCINTGKLSSDLLLINYPQIKSTSLSQINDLKMFLEKSLSHPDLSNYLEGKTNIVIKEYFELNESLPLDIKLNDKNVVFVKERGLSDNKEYLEIEEITIGIETALISIRKHGEYGGNLTFFEKENEQWMMQPRTLEEKQNTIDKTISNK